MGKFSESSYSILEEYFTQLNQGVGEGTDNSYITGTRKTIYARGSLSTTLYQKQDNGNFVGFKFDIQSLTGNDFKFKYKSKISTNTLATDLQVGSEMYFRKDSLFHDWLKNNAALYENAINTNKTHIYFGKIYAVTGEVNNYNVIFDGLKDFVTYALPEHQRTDKIVELMKIFFDAVYHDIYNMTKTMWSFIDAKEVNIDHIDYLATRAGISTDKDLIESEDLLREFVDQLIFWLKRKGTYTSYLLPYKLLARNTKNKLNFYERWVDWCLREFRQNISYIPETDFFDHHYSEYYGVSPTGGAGVEYYSRYDHNRYPEYADVPPTAGCIENSIQCSQLRDWTSSIVADDTSSLSTVAAYNLQIDGFNPGPPGPAGDRLFVYDPAPTGGVAQQTPYCMTVSMTPSALPCGGVFVWAMSNHSGLGGGLGDSLDEHIDTYNEPFIGISFEAVGRPPSGAVTNRRFKLWEHWKDGRLFATESSGSYVEDTEYFLTVHSTSATSPSAAELVLDVFSDSSRRDATFLEQVKLQLHEYRKYNSLYSLNYLYQPSAAKFWGDIQDQYYGSRNVNAIPLPSGNFVLSPHYKLEIDLSSEPFGEDYILNEGLIDELIRYWDYLRPVSKYIHFHELISPIARIEEIGEYVSLYDPTLTAVCDTKFLGTIASAAAAIPLSAAQTPSGNTDWYIGTAVHVQPTSLLSWNFQHNFGTKRLLSQVFDNSDEWVIPARLNNETANLQRIEFSPARRGRAFGATLKPYNKSHYQSTPATAWDIIHNMGTSGVSGGVLCQVYETDLTADIIPDQIQEIDDNTVKITFDEPASGFAFLRDDDYHHVQSSPSTEWTITHNLNVRGVLISFKDHERKVIYPDNIYIDTYNQVRGVFSEAVCGTADLILFEREFEEDTFSESMINGFWKVGTGGDQAFDPEIRNDLATTVLSGSIYNWSETSPEPSGSYVAEFKIPTGEEYTLNEMGLFNEDNVMQFYTKMNTLHKPKRAQLDVFYRIRKQ